MEHIIQSHRSKHRFGVHAIHNCAFAHPSITGQTEPVTRYLTSKVHRIHRPWWHFRQIIINLLPPSGDYLSRTRVKNESCNARIPQPGCIEWCNLCLYTSMKWRSPRPSWAAEIVITPVGEYFRASRLHGTHDYYWVYKCELNLMCWCGSLASASMCAGSWKLD